MKGIVRLEQMFPPSGSPSGDFHENEGQSEDASSTSTSPSSLPELHQLLQEERQKNRFLEVEIIRLRKLLHACKKKLRLRSEQLKVKTEALERIYEERSYVELQPCSPTLPLEDIDLDSLLTVNLDADTFCTFLEGSLEDLDLDVTELEPREEDGIVSLPGESLQELAVNSSYVLEPQAKKPFIEILSKQREPVQVKKVSPLKLCKNLKKGRYEVNRDVGVESGEGCQVDDKFYKPYNCSLCDSNFEYRSSLEAHNELHKWTFPWQCAKCKEVFKNLINFVNHARTFHEVNMMFEIKELLSTNKK